MRLVGSAAVLDLQVDERSYYVRCHMNDLERARRLERGQLVGVRGRGKGAPNDRPELSECAVYWGGDNPRHAPDDRITPALAAGRSAVICASIENSTEMHRIAAERGISISTVPRLQEMLRDNIRLGERARAALEKAGISPLPCEHPIVRIVIRCMTIDGLGSSPAAPIVEGDTIFFNPGRTGRNRSAQSVGPDR